MTSIDLDDVSGCPVGVRCESCGQEGDDLSVRTAWTPLGVFCWTACPRCAASSLAPPVALSTASRLVVQHCNHLGIDLAEMVAILANGVAE